MNENINKQYSLSSKIIDKFNETVSNLYQNEISLERRLIKATVSLKQQANETQIINIAGTLNQILFMYQATEKLLDRLITAIAFIKIKTLHPTIISITDLYNSLLKLKNITNPGQLPFEVKKENIPNFRKLIKIKYFTDNKNKILFILEIPIYHVNSFDLYKLYPIPIWHQFQSYRLLLPDARHVLLSENHIAYETEDCQETNKIFFCKSTIIENTNKENCEANIILHKKLTNCTQHTLEISETQILKIEDTDFWLLLSSDPVDIKTICNAVQEIKTLHGSYLLQIQENCLVEINKEKIQPIHIENMGQPILFEFKNISTYESPSRTFDSSRQLKPMNLEDINELRNLIKFSQIRQYRNGQDFNHHYILYVAVALLFVVIIIKRYFKDLPWKIRQRRKPTQEPIPLEVLLPRSTFSEPESTKGGVTCP